MLKAEMMQHDINIEKVMKFTRIKELSEYLSDKNVTTLSKFSDGTWRFDTKPHTLSINFSNYEKQYNNRNLTVFWKLYVYLLIIKKNLQNYGRLNPKNHSVRLIEYLSTNGFLVDNNFLFTKDNAHEFINILSKTKGTVLHKKVQLNSIKDWLFINKFLPSFFQLPYDPLIGIDTNSIFDTIKEENEGNDQIVLTIPSALFLTKEAIIWIEKYSDDILNIFSEWINYKGKDPKCKTFIAYGKKYTVKHGGVLCQKKLTDIIYSSFDTAPDDKHPLSHIWKQADKYTKKEISSTDLLKTTSSKDITHYIRVLYGACIALIVFTTGMRKIELFSLERGCIDYKTHSEIPLITSDVTKTNTGITKLPISRIGARAVHILEKLGEIYSGKSIGPLMTPIEQDKEDSELNKIANYSSHAEKMLYKFCTHIGYGKAPNLHSFRHVLAACVWERTDQAPVLLNMLYNHSSLSMTLWYLKRNPLIKLAQKELFTKKYLPLVREVIHSEKKDELSGKASARVRGLVNYITNNISFQGKTEEELDTAMEELFMTLIEQDQLRLFLTPFCICMRTNNSDSKSPCMLIEDHRDSLFGKLPRTDRCVGSDCNDSIFTAQHKNSIHQSMSYYRESIDLVPDDLKNNIYFATIANHETVKYEKIEKKLEKKGKKNA